MLRLLLLSHFAVLFTGGHYFFNFPGSPPVIRRDIETGALLPHLQFTGHYPLMPWNVKWVRRGKGRENKMGTYERKTVSKGNSGHDERVGSVHILPSNFLLPFQAHCEHGFSAWPIIYTLSLGQGHEGNRVHRLQATVSPVFLCLMRGFL